MGIRWHKGIARRNFGLELTLSVGRLLCVTPAPDPEWSVEHGAVRRVDAAGPHGLGCGRGRVRHEK